MPVFAVELRVVQTVSAGNMDEAAEIAFDELSMFDPKIGHIEELGPSEESQLVWLIIALSVSAYCSWWLQQNVHEFWWKY